MHPTAVQSFIDGEWQGALDERILEKPNPFTGEIIFITALAQEHATRSGHYFQRLR